MGEGEKNFSIKNGSELALHLPENTLNLLLFPNKVSTFLPLLGMYVGVFVGCPRKFEPAKEKGQTVMAGGSSCFGKGNPVEETMPRGD